VRPVQVMGQACANTLAPATTEVPVMAVLEVTPSEPETRGKRKRVGRGIYERSGGFEICYPLASGKMKFEKLPRHIDTKTKAESERRKRLVAVEEGTAPVHSKATLDDVAADFFEAFAAKARNGRRSERTQRLYEQRYRTHLQPKLGSTRVQKITSADIVRLITELDNAGKAPWTTKGILTTLASILKYAVRHEHIHVSPMSQLGEEVPSGERRKEARALDVDQCGKLIANTAEGWKVLVSVLVFCGLRISECLALRWEDVDYEAGLIHVQWQLTVARKGEPAKLVRPKTKRGIRDIYMPLPLARELQRYRFNRSHTTDSDFIFATRNGKPLTQRNADRAIRKAGERAKLNPDGLKSVSAHDLRHSAITRWIEDGVDLVRVSAMAGHSKVSTTTDEYSHVIKRVAESKREAETRAKMDSSGIGAVLGVAS
jgi:integrase